MNTAIKITAWKRVSDLTTVHADRLMPQIYQDQKVENDTADRHKVVWKLFASLLEEIGEVAAALKIEEGIVKHKKADESSSSEMADVVICGIMMYFALNGSEDEVVFSLPMNGKLIPDEEIALYKKTGPFEELARLNYYVAKLGYSIMTEHQFPGIGADPRTLAIQLSNAAVSFFVAFDGTEDELYTKIHQKLDKWEKNQKGNHEG